MSGLARTYQNVVGALQRGEAFQLRLGGVVVNASEPEDVVGPNGEPLKQVYVQLQGPDGPVEAQVRMSPSTYEKSLVRAEKLTPRLQVLQQRLQLRERNTR